LAIVYLNIPDAPNNQEINIKWINKSEIFLLLAPLTSQLFSPRRRVSLHGAARYLNFSNPIFFPPAYFPALIHFGRERGWWVTCNYLTVLKEKNGKGTTCAICWIKSVLHDEKHLEQENHNI
jgi:hypothetical protein